jgi:hypothetical protein
MAPLFLLNGDMEIADNAADENELLAEASDMFQPVLPVSTSFGEAIVSRRLAEVAAGQEEAVGGFTERQRLPASGEPGFAPLPLAWNNPQW